MTVTAPQLAACIIATASDFVGLVERESNAHWDDPKTPWRDVDKDIWLRTWMRKIPGWTEGAPYCAAFDGAVVAASFYKLTGEVPAKFLKRWTAHVMTNVRALREVGLLSSGPDKGGIWLAKHGDTDSGHAGVVVDDPFGPTIVCIEGNTSAGPTADPQQQRQGDGIWLRTFDQRGRGTLRTQGFCNPEALLKLAA